MDCIFCNIASGQIPAQIVRQDEHTVAFRDVNPQAPVHVLVIPRRHITSVSDVESADREVMGALFIAAREIAEAENVAATGYRRVINAGDDAGQSVAHIHLHVLGGRSLKWPPG
jgi:histidine triad (HIT) family protein